MRVMGLKAIQKKKFKRTTDSNHNLPRYFPLYRNGIMEPIYFTLNSYNSSFY